MANRPPIVGYARVSREEQADSLPTQRARLLGAGAERIIEDVQSGQDHDRRGYLELLSGIQDGTIGGVVVTRLDRLGRDAAEVDALLAFAAKRKVRIQAIDGGQLESQTPGGFALTRVMSTMAELESRMLSLRIRSSLKARRLQGAPLRGRPPWGYRLTQDRQHLEPDPAEWPRVQKFLALMEANDWRSQTTLRQWLLTEGPLPLNSVSAISHWLVNPVLRGGLGYHKAANRIYDEVIWDQHPALLTEEQYRQIMRRKAENRRHWGKNVRYTQRLLTGLVRCWHCRMRMHYIPHRVKPGLLCHSVACPMHYKTVYEADIVKAIHQALCARAEDLAAAVVSDNPEADELLHQIQRLEALNDDDLAPVIALKRQKMQELHKRPPIDQELVEQLRRPEFWAAATPEEQRELFQDLVEEVEVEDLKPKRVRLRF